MKLSAGLVVILSESFCYLSVSVYSFFSFLFLCLLSASSVGPTYVKVDSFNTLSGTKSSCVRKSVLHSHM